MVTDLLLSGRTPDSPTAIRVPRSRRAGNAAFVGDWFLEPPTVAASTVHVSPVSDAPGGGPMVDRARENFYLNVKHIVFNSDKTCSLNNPFNLHSLGESLVKRLAGV